jgi:hypothetical protein
MPFAIPSNLDIPVRFSVVTVPSQANASHQPFPSKTVKDDLHISFSDGYSLFNQPNY